MKPKRKNEAKKKQRATINKSTENQYTRVSSLGKKISKSDKPISTLTKYEGKNLNQPNLKWNGRNNKYE